MTRPAFEWICEIEPPTKPDMMHVRHQIGVLSKVASAYLIPDNHVGRATVSSIAVAHEVDRMGGRSIACLNARDRNALGFRRDLLQIPGRPCRTAATNYKAIRASTPRIDPQKAAESRKSGRSIRTGRRPSPGDGLHRGA